MSWAISSADACPSLKMRLRVRYMRPHDATPTVTGTLTAMSQIFVRMVKPTSIYRGRAERGEGDGQGGGSRARAQKKPPGGRGQPGVIGRSRPEGRIQPGETTSSPRPSSPRHPR